MHENPDTPPTAMPQVRAWFDRDLHTHPWIRAQLANSTDAADGIRFSTPACSYAIHAEDARPGQPSYLGATFTVNGQRLAGDLPDGECCEATWKEIALAIVENELRMQKHRPPGRSR